ncbi:MAG: YidC/Oxa1 family insertase periplasmic-domain containing protein [Bacteroidales bacterium]
MDRNTITGLALIFAIFLGFSLYNNSRVTKSFEESMSRADSLYSLGEMENARIEYLKALKYKPNTIEASERVSEINLKLRPELTETTQDTAQVEQAAVTVKPAESSTSQGEPLNQDYLGAFAGSGQGEQEFITLENNRVTIKISTRGGRIYSAELKDFYTHDMKPLVLFDGDSTVFGFNFFTADNKPIRTNDLYFTPYNTGSYIDASTGTGVAVLRLPTSGSGYIEYTYSLDPDEYIMEFNVKFVGLEQVIAQNQNALTLNWASYIPQQEKGRTNEFNYTQLKYKHYQDEVDGFRERSQISRRLKFRPNPRWVFQRPVFLNSRNRRKSLFSNGYVTSASMPETGKYLKYFTAELGLPYNATLDNDFQLHIFMGPNNFKLLKSYGYELHQVIFLKEYNKVDKPDSNYKYF